MKWKYSSQFREKKKNVKKHCKLWAVGLLGEYIFKTSECKLKWRNNESGWVRTLPQPICLATFDVSKVSETPCILKSAEERPWPYPETGPICPFNFIE